MAPVRIPYNTPNPTAKDWPKPKPKPKPKSGRRSRHRPRSRSRGLNRAGSGGRGQRHRCRIGDQGGRNSHEGQEKHQQEDGGHGQNPRLGEVVILRGECPSVSALGAIPQVSASGCSSSCVGSLSRCRCCSRRELSQLGRRSSGGGPNAFFRPCDGSAILLDLPPPFAGRPRGSDAERPGQHGQRSDDEQREGRDRQVENQSHGARRVADRSFSGRSAWAAPRCR